MKKMRKIFAVLLTLAMVLAMSIPTFAAGATATITLSGDTLTKDTAIKYVQIVEPDTTGSTLGWKFSSDTIANEFIKAFKVNDTSVKTADDAISKLIDLGVDTALVPNTDYTVNEYKDTASLQIAFIYNPDYAGKTVTIKYTAVVGAGEGNVVNKIESNFDKDGDSVTSAKVKFTVIKKGKENKKLPGAEFTLYEYSEVEKEGYIKVDNASVIDTRTENASGTKTIWVKQVGNPQETSAEEATKGETTFVGLDAQKTYCVQETNAPTGYKIQKDYHVLTGANSTTLEGSKVYTFDNFDDVTVTDENLSALPSTGGIGTTIFTIAGCLIMVAAAGLFFASRKRTNK